MKDYEALLVALRQITRAIDLHSRQLLKETGLTTSQLLILDAITRQAVATPTSIARDIHLSQATVTNIVVRLEKNGLVERHRSGDDRRSVQLTLTAQGQGIIDAAPELLQADFLKQYRELQPWEANLLLSALQRLATMMHAEKLDVSPILALGELAEESEGLAG
ncbi:MAG: MarR family winged helix-turn-helix transcriptional regulator [Pseudohongiellaceae bacterium]|jgi:DNA-binding MarR family transcriptional regulator